MVLTLLLLSIGIGSASGQKLKPLADTAVPRRPAYGIGQDEFLIGAVKAWIPESGIYGHHWIFARELGIRVLEIRNDDRDSIEQLRDFANAGLNERLFLDIKPSSLGGTGREVTFYPFDSAQNYYYQNVFTYTAQSAGLQTKYNEAIDPDRPPEEAIYAPSTVDPGEVVAANIAFGYRPDWHTHRYPQYQWDPHEVDTRSFVTHDVPYLSFSGRFALVVTGHVFDPIDPNQGGGGADSSDAILQVEVWNEVPKGATYRLPDGLHTAVGDTEYVFATIDVLKKHLEPIPDSLGNRNYNIYRSPEYILSFDTAASPIGMLYGPHHPDMTAHRMDIRVRFTGKEKVALRSITLRDSAAQLANGSDAAGIAYRQEVVDVARRMIFGKDGDADPARVVRFYSGDEGGFYQHAGWTTIDSLLYGNFPMGQDSTIRGVRAYRANSGHHNHIQHTMDDQPEISVETYTRDITNAFSEDISTYYGLPDSINQPPQIARHNGGRYKAPVADTTWEGVEMYENALQRMYVGAYNTGESYAPYETNWSNALGHAAWASRRTGKRLLHWLGTHSALNILWTWDSAGERWYRVPWMTRITEPAEMRMMANLGLCYGSRGVEYSWVGTTMHDYNDQDGLTAHPRWVTDAAHKPLRYYSDIGSVGESSNATGRTDFFPVFAVESHDQSMRDTLFDFWTGWGVRTAEMRWLGQWLPRIGEAMKRLQWKDAYSMHFTQTQEWMLADISGNSVTRSRPLPESMIVAGVEAVDRYGTVDLPQETYVELGFFDQWHGPSRMYDTNHLFIVNRRSFERTNDIPRIGSDSVLAKKLDKLAEARTIMVKLRMKHPDTTQYNFIRVRELAPDTNRLPWASVPREGLDTVVHGDSAFAVTLRPGGGALLQLTYCNANDSLAIGDLRFSNSKKLVFDGRYWHATYHRPLTFWKPPQKTTPTTEDAVFYRRSYPVDSSLGAIRWDPRKEFEVLLSDTVNDARSRENRFPSITVRSDSSKPGDRVVTAVWSCYGSPGSNGKREVLLRNVRVYDDPFTPVRGPIEKVADYWGHLDTAWGTPVVSRLHGGYMIAYSDSLFGILARFRRLDGAANWWILQGVYSPADTVSRTFTRAGQYPSLPPFAHVKGRDSSIAIVWQQRQQIGSSIQYARLVHRKAMNPTVDSIADMNRMRVSPINNAHYVHPSIDMTQDVWFGAQEGVAWESKDQWWDTQGGTHTTSRLHFSSLWTETSRGYNPSWVWYDSNNVQHIGGNWRPYHDSIEQVWRWTQNTMVIADRTVPILPDFYPNTASLNGRIDTLHTHDSIYFSIAMSPIPNITTMQQSIVQYATTFLWTAPRQYQIGGHYPSMASSLTRLGTREAALFQADRETASKMETTKQFFAKSRPRGYMAYGRQVYFPISEATMTAISGALHDVWFAGEGGTGSLRLTERPDSLRRTDSLATVRTLFRTASFHAHDSTAIGCLTRGRLFGDTTLARGMRVEFITELVDSATDNVVARLDSFAIAPGLDSHDVALEPVLDLLSGTYYVRMRIESVGVTVDAVSHAPRYPVEELASYVEEEPAGKVRWLNGRGAASQSRITAQPNPVPDATELRFSVPNDCRVTITVFDYAGQEVRRVLNGAMMQEGRYAIDMDATGLAPGSYLVEFRYGAKRAVEKIVVTK